MAGISRSRWRKAWIDGVVVGATGRGQCQLTAPKLIATFQRGVNFGKANIDTLYVKTAVAQKRPRNRFVPPLRRAGLSGLHATGQCGKSLVRAIEV